MYKLQHIIVLFLVIFACQSTQTCECLDLKSQFDCEYQKCFWDNSQNSCSQQPSNVKQYQAYCDQFEQIDCSKQFSCSWIEIKCTFFTACTAYTKKTNEECQKISNRCQSNGTHCFELKLCTDSKQKSTCQQNSLNKYCYWDQSQNICSDATQCNQLPFTLRTDNDCRTQISWCTAKVNGGCIESGANCIDQQIKDACVWNADKSIACFWTVNGCRDKACEHAPNILTTDQSCQLYKSDGSCTTKLNGGCVTRTTCEAATIQNACNVIGETQCVSKICENAPQTYTANQACANFKQGCITKQGGGCIINGSCSVADTKSACFQNIDGKDCIWTNTNQSQEKSCDNASTTIQSNQDCEQYLPNNNCITKLNGGCTTNTTCQAITIKQACLKDVQGQICFWDVITSSCLEKKCSNAPSNLTNHDLCQQFQSQCTVNATKNGCVDWTCEIISEQSICQYQNCSWKGPCSPKFCSQAPQNLNTFEGCQNYNINCTLSNLGIGCMDIPQICQYIKLQGACRIKKIDGSIFQCGWDGYKCIDQGCTTLDKNINSTQQCNSVLKGCVSANPLNGKIYGCMDLPSTCEERMSKENCEENREKYPICIWRASSDLIFSCVLKTCQTANLTGGLPSIYSNLGCKMFLNTCIMENSQKGCRTKPNSCSELVQVNCLEGSLNGDCFWNTTSCVDKICDNLIGMTNHIDCNQTLSTCTVNEKKSGCQLFTQECSSYKISEQCQFTLNMGKCIWTGVVCRNSFCNDAPDTIDYDTATECQAFLAVKEKCIVLNKTGGQGCVRRQQECSQYTSKSQCFRTLSLEECLWINNFCIGQKQLTQFCGKYTIEDQCQGYCLWYNNRCYGIFDLSTTTCSTPFGSQGNCQFYKITSKKEEMKINQIDYSVFNCEQKVVSPTTLNWTQCQKLDGTCSVNLYGSTCINKYFDIIRVVQISQNKKAVIVWDKYTPNICGLIVYGVDCAFQKSLPGDFAHSDCQACSKLCTVIYDGSSCQEFLANCSNYQNQNSCTQSQNGRCIWNGKSCQQITNPKTECSFINGKAGTILYQHCQSYHIGCSINQDGSACIGQKEKCSDYSAECVNPYTNTCKCNYATEGQCVLIGTQCVKKTCDQPLPNSQYDTDSECSSYLSICTVARIGGCQAISDCNSYQQNQCQFNSLGNKCFWNPSQMNCVDLLCWNIEQSTFFDTHEECYAIDSTLQCTVQSQNGQVFQGCMNRMSCVQYTIQEQCHLNNLGEQCVWKNGCYDQTCYTAPQTYTSYNECKQYSNKFQCTVAVKQIPNGDSYLLQGCQPVNDCFTYLVQEQCVTDVQGNDCVWVGKACSQKSCFTAPDSCSNDQDCKKYYNDTCITNYFKKGCIKIPLSCEGVTQNECIIDQQGKPCYWNDDKCITRSCLNAPLNITNELGCQQYLNQCSFNIQKCQKKICEDYPLGNDGDCKSAMNSCTTDGVLCVKRRSCMDAQTQEGCVTAEDGSPCEWIESGYCTTKILKNCEIAPYILLTDADCASYMPICTVQKEGGCIKRSICESITYKEACTTDLNGRSCIWNNNQCSLDICQQLTGVDHPSCFSQNKNCTIGSNTQCTRIRNCNQTTLKAACYEGIDGPCLWLEYQGICIQYTDCTSLQYTSDTECKKVSSQCTTNGIQCIGISLCSETNLNGCVTGIDGDCFKKGFICQKRSICTDQKYLTHTACQEIDDHCTTNGNTGCIYLSDCKTYKQAGCYLNDKSKQVDSKGAITSTGKCTWDSKQQSCRDLECKDFKGSNHNQCNILLSTCTSDGKSCITQANFCDSYLSYNICNIAYGTEGQCYWNSKNQQCKKVQCADIKNGTDTKYCSSVLSECISDGTQCILKNDCSSYKTQIACQSGGRDGFCTIEIVAQDQRCVKAKCSLYSQQQCSESCFWSSENTCLRHTCQTYQKMWKKCSSFYSLDYNYQILCQQKGVQCIQYFETSNVNGKDCLKSSNYTQTWDQLVDKCVYCKQNTSPGTSGNSTNITVVEEAYILFPLYPLLLAYII